MTVIFFGLHLYIFYCAVQIPRTEMCCRVITSFCIMLCSVEDFDVIGDQILWEVSDRWPFQLLWFSLLVISWCRTISVAMLRIVLVLLLAAEPHEAALSHDKCIIVLWMSILWAFLVGCVTSFIEWIFWENAVLLLISVKFDRIVRKAVLKIFSWKNVVVISCTSFHRFSFTLVQLILC